MHDSDTTGPRRPGARPGAGQHARSGDGRGRAVVGVAGRARVRARRRSRARARAARRRCAACCSRTTAPRSTRVATCARSVTVAFDAGGAPRLSGDDAVGQVLAIVAVAAADGHLGAPEGVPRGRLPLGVLRLLPQPLAHVVHDEHVRQPRQGADLPRASAEGRRSSGSGRGRAACRRAARAPSRPRAARRSCDRDAVGRLGRAGSRSAGSRPGGRAARSACSRVSRALGDRRLHQRRADALRPAAPGRRRSGRGRAPRAPRRAPC